MSAVLEPLEAQFEVMTEPWLHAVMQVELSAYAHPWSHRNFSDSLSAGYEALVLLAAPESQCERSSARASTGEREKGTQRVPFFPDLQSAPSQPDRLLGYFVAMHGVDEVHLLNLTVTPSHHGRGWARVMLDALALWSRGQRAQWLWLEVRMSNIRARVIYERYGFRHVGTRRDYPAANSKREDAVVMSMAL